MMMVVVEMVFLEPFHWVMTGSSVIVSCLVRSPILILVAPSIMKKTDMMLGAQQAKQLAGMIDRTGPGPLVPALVS